MKNRVLPALFSVILGLLIAPTALAWDATGHMQIADIAWANLSKHAKSEITLILKAGDPAFRPASDSEADIRAAFRKSATFCDVIKGDRSTQYEAILPEMNLTFFTKTKPDPANNEDVLCKTWHYYDVPIRDKGNHPAEDSNAVNAFNLAREKFYSLEKAGGSDRQTECWWLYWIEHIAGDVHQPLHCVSSYEFVTDKGDAGGNRIMVIDPARPDRPTRLHSYWDAGITHAIAADKEAGLAVTPEDVTKRWGSDPALKPSAADLKVLDIMAWVKAGAAIADKTVYADLKPNSTLSAQYATDQITLCKKQAELAGLRMAAVLNAGLK